MAKQRRWLLRLLLLIVVLIAAAVLLAPFVPLSPLKPAVETRLSSKLGRKVTVGSIYLTLVGGPYLTINQLVAKEDAAFGDGNFLVVEQVRANVAFSPLALRREFVIQALEVTSPDLTLIKNGEGAWNWTTVGESATAGREAGTLGDYRHRLLCLIADAATEPAIERISVKRATIRVIDRSGEQKPDSFYKNVDLDASITDAGAGGSSAKGELRARSEQTDSTDLLNTEMPFDLLVGKNQASGRVIKGRVGPGRFESKNFAAEGFQVEAEMPDFQQSISTLNGTGRMQSDNLFIASVNVSEQVARKLGIEQIGDMSPGTRTGPFESDFQIDQGVVRTTNMRIQQMDGLGDATANQGWFEIASAPTLSYVVTVLLTSEATARVKSTSPLFGAIISILESNNRFAVPVNITGEVRNPQVQVDVSRILN